MKSATEMILVRLALVMLITVGSSFARAGDKEILGGTCVNILSEMKPTTKDRSAAIKSFAQSLHSLPKPGSHEFAKIVENIRHGLLSEDGYSVTDLGRYVDFSDTEVLFNSFEAPTGTSGGSVAQPDSPIKERSI